MSSYLRSFYDYAYPEEVEIEYERIALALSSYYAAAVRISEA
jgi:hypothetical protein